MSFYIHIVPNDFSQVIQKEATQTWPMLSSTKQALNYWMGVMSTARLIFFRLLFFIFMLWLDLFLKIWQPELKITSDMVLPEGEISKEMYPRSPQNTQSHKSHHNI